MKSSSGSTAGSALQAPGIASIMETEESPTPPEELVGKDELDEDDEMELSTDDLVQN